MNITLFRPPLKKDGQSKINRTRSRRMGLPIRAPLITAMAIALSLLFVATALAGSNSDQCANGAFGSTNNTTSCPSSGGTGGDWQNGNLNSQNSLFSEGDSVPYRDVFTGTASTGNTFTIEWQAMNSGCGTGCHGFDYLTTWNRTVTGSNPCQGVTGCTLASPSSSVAIPSDTGANGSLNAICGFTGSQIAGFFTMWNGTITNVSAYSQSGCFGNANSTNTITITFSTINTSNPVVLAWGGHIAAQTNWTAGTAASGISGAPYHMIENSCNFSCSGKNLNLQAGTVAGFTTQSTTAGAASINTPTQDTLNLTGNVKKSNITGSAQFYICADNSAPYANPTCTTGNRTAVGSAVNVTINAVGNNEPTGSVSSPAYTPTANGAYCWSVDFTTTSIYPSFTNLTNTTTECFTIQSTTAVTLSDFSARTEDGRGLTIAALGVMGLALLGTLTLVFARKR